MYIKMLVKVSPIHMAHKAFVYIYLQFLGCYADEIQFTIILIDHPKNELVIRSLAPGVR